MCARTFVKNILRPRSSTSVFGVGVPDGYWFGGSDWRRGMVAKIYLFRRVREVNANPSTFSEYTIEFAKLFADHWDCTNEGEWEKE